MCRRRIFGKTKDENTMLLLHFNGNTIDAVGKYPFVDTGVGKSTNAKFGTGAANFGNGLLYFNDKSWFWNLVATGNYTIDFWHYYKSTNTLFITDDMSGDAYGFALGVNLNPSAGVYGLYFGNWTTRLVVSSSYFVSNQYNHVAVVSQNKTVMIFINGVLRASRTQSLRSASYKLCIGGRQGGDPFYAGLVDEFRISNIARWTSNFTPPTKPY